MLLGIEPDLSMDVHMDECPHDVIVRVNVPQDEAVTSYDKYTVRNGRGGATHGGFFYFRPLAATASVVELYDDEDQWTLLDFFRHNTVSVRNHWAYRMAIAFYPSPMLAVAHWNVPTSERPERLVFRLSGLNLNIGRRLTIEQAIGVAGRPDDIIPTALERLLES